MTKILRLDGARGEGGGQILRTALTFAAITGRAFRIENIRAGREKPGLAAQHVTAARAAAALCRARVRGDAIGSDALEFFPEAAVAAGEYLFDVAAAREGGSAGAATLVLQTLLLPLALVEGESRVVVRGGTHMSRSPSFDYLQDVYLPTLARIGIEAEVELNAWGWYPAGGGEIEARIRGLGREWRHRLRPLDIRNRGGAGRISGRAVAANLPSHIPQRMSDRTRGLLQELDAEVRIEPLRVRAACPGAGIFLLAEYDHVRCGFSALGERGKASELVAEEAVSALFAHRNSGAALDQHLADQILNSLALAPCPSAFSAELGSRHLQTNAWVIERFGLARIGIERQGAGALVQIEPRASEHA